MVTRATIIKNIAFALLGVLVLGYISLRYADLGRFVGYKNYYIVKVELPDTGGLYSQSQVTYRGVAVGRVDKIGLTPDGVEAELRISKSAPRIPTELQAVVSDLSAIGEQYLDLRPTSVDGPYLHAGSVIPAQQTTLPEPVTDVLTSVNSLVNSVPLQSLKTVVDELDKAFANQGDNLQVLLDNGTSFLNAAQKSLPSSTALLNNSTTVLATQADEGSALTSFTQSLQALAGQLASSDTDLRNLIIAAPQAATQVDELLRQVNPSLSVLLANLLTTSQIVQTRADGLQEFLVRVPVAASIGATEIRGGTTNFGMAVTFFDPLACTSGYGGTTYRNGLDTSSSGVFNTNAGCTLPPGSGTDVRGSENAP